MVGDGVVVEVAAVRVKDLVLVRGLDLLKGRIGTTAGVADDD